MVDGRFDEHRPADGAAPEQALAFDCPRCGRAAVAWYWGPCEACREDLGLRQRRDAREVDADGYEPKMNVVPNQVATKE